jgi:hypothetical protein
MAESSGRQIRSYHRAFHFELELHTLGNIRLWRPIPARGIFYTAAAELVTFAAAHAPVIGAAILRLGWEAVYGLIPLSVAWLLTIARVEGRRFHVAARAWGKQLLAGRHVAGGYRTLKPPGSRWRPAPVVLIGDGRDGVAPQGLRLTGPGRVLLRYPCQARRGGSTLTIAQTSQVPCDPGRVLTIAEGATVRFAGASVDSAHGRHASDHPPVDGHGRAVLTDPLGRRGPRRAAGGGR